MPKKVKSTEEHLQTIEYMLAGIILKREVDIKQIAKVIGALIRLNLEILKNSMNKKLTDKEMITILNSTGLTPTEIAKILGKKSATAIAPYLYNK